MIPYKVDYNFRLIYFYYENACPRPIELDDMLDRFETNKLNDEQLKKLWEEFKLESEQNYQGKDLMDYRKERIE